MSPSFWNPSAGEEPSGDIRELAASRSFESVLDVGCGTGRNLVPFAVRGCRVYGIDTDPSAVSTSRERLSNTLAEFVGIELADVRTYVPKRQFDLVTCYGVLHFLRRSDRRLAYRRLASWVAPGGLIAVVMFNKRLPIPGDLRRLMPEPAADSDGLRRAFPGWAEISFRSYNYEDEHDGGRIKHMHSIDRLIAQAPVGANA